MLVILIALLFAPIQLPPADLVELRHDLHRHPEVSGQEVRTARVVADRMKAAGLEVRVGIGGHGVVATLRGGRPGPLVAYRADMDAVPSNDADPSAIKSETPGVRHICGHDLHVTIAVGIAESLARRRATLSGSVMFIFQPAEERATGAGEMLKDGVFAAGKPVAIYGLHTSPQRVGVISSKPDRMMLANAIAPGVVNDAALFARAKADVIAALGADAFSDLNQPPAGFSEDFGLFQEQVPGVFFFVGASSTGRVAAPHSPNFELDDAAIAVGIKAMTAVLLGRLSGK